MIILTVVYISPTVLPIEGGQRFTVTCKRLVSQGQTKYFEGHQNFRGSVVLYACLCSYVYCSVHFGKDMWIFWETPEQKAQIHAGKLDTSLAPERLRPFFSF